MDAIFNNPFRILGLPTIASDKEIAKRVSDLLIYAEMGKKVTYDTDLPFIGELDRSVESIKLAAKRIELPENKIFYSLLCFDIKDNFDKKIIELLNEGDISAAFTILKNEIDNNRPKTYIPYNGKTVNSLLKALKLSNNNQYRIFDPPFNYNPKSIIQTKSTNKNILIKQSEDFIDIQEGTAKVEFSNNYQLVCKFKWLENPNNEEVFLGLGFTNDSQQKHFISISNKGLLRFYQKNVIEFEEEIDKGIFYGHGYNFLTLQIIDGYLEVFIKWIPIVKIETKSIYKSSLLCFSGNQSVTIEMLFISDLIRIDLETYFEMNEKTFFYVKNFSLFYLFIILQEKNANHLFTYFGLIGNILKQPYFNSLTKFIISNNYLCNFDVLTDIFVKEFYLSFNHLVDPNDGISQSFFLSSFSKLPCDADKKVKTMALGNKVYVFENFIKAISLKRIKEPVKTYDFACELKNEATHFYNWYSEFYNFGDLESKSISDKIGNEILECSIAYYNAHFQKTIEIAIHALKLMTWASDFAFNEALRNRINESISILLKAYPNTEYKIVDFGFKDRTRSTRRGTSKDKPAETKSNNVPPQKINNSQSSQTSTITTRQPEAEKSKKLNQRKNTILKSLLKNTGGLFLIMLPVILMIYLFLTPFFSKNSSLNKEKNIPNPIENKIDNNSPIQSKSNLNIDLSNYKSKDQQTDVIQESKWQGNKLQNGDSPYDGAFGKGLYDYNSKCYLIFKNGNSTDAIVCLENTVNGHTIRNEYIQAGTDYRMTNIPEGIYKVKTFSGNNWNPEKTMNQGGINGVFDTDLSFSISDKPSDLVQMSITETGEGISYSTGEITLYTVSNGNMQQRNINSDEFFR